MGTTVLDDVGASLDFCTWQPLPAKLSLLVVVGKSKIRKFCCQLKIRIPEQKGKKGHCCVTEEGGDQFCVAYLCHGKGAFAKTRKWVTRFLASTLGTGPLACLSLFPVAEFG